MKYPAVRKVDLAKPKITQPNRCYASALILTHDNKILLQQRGENWPAFPGFLTTFGGQIEKGETPMQGLIRELDEELGAKVDPSDVIEIGAITEKITHYSEWVHTYFWRDKNGTITGCYEGEPRYYKNIEAIHQHPKVMDYVFWLLNECRKRKLLK